MKIDIYNHILPPRYFRKIQEIQPQYQDIGKRVREVPMLTDLDVRFRVMDGFGGDYRQILNICSPFPDTLGGPKDSPDLAKMVNDEMAELVARYPDRFPAFAAVLPMNNMDAAVIEIHRAIKTLGARGIQIKSNIDGRPLDAPEFAPLFETLAAYDLPIWVHPQCSAKDADYATETTSKYEIWWTFRFPYETTVFMARMVFSKLFEKLPNIKIITHHLGAMVPYFEGRVGPGMDQLGSRTSDQALTALRTSLKRRPLDYFKMFYADTATFGSASATRCGLDFFGAEHVLFGSDAPFDPEQGPMYIRETIRIIDGLEISREDRDRIYHGNAARLLKLDPR